MLLLLLEIRYQIIVIFINLFKFCPLHRHYVVLGPEGTPYVGGLYHGKLIFPRQFPFKPPSIYMITPSGRYLLYYSCCYLILICYLKIQAIAAAMDPFVFFWYLSPFSPSILIS